MRTTTQGYGAADETKQKYALLERDEETGQDHAWWRKYENTAGRWTTPDPYADSMSIIDPQSLNRYAYVSNDPANRIDPSGLEETVPHPDFSMFWDFIGYVNAGPGFIPEGGEKEPKGLRRRKPRKTAEDEERQRQQSGFNNCAKGKIRDFRRAEYGSIAKIAIGTFFTALSAGVGTAAGAANAAAQTGARSAGARIVGYTARYKFGELLAKGAPVVGAFTGTLAINGGIESWNNHEQLAKALASCKSQFPQADHSTLGIFLTTY